MTATILVINPNSNQVVTDGLDVALAPFRTAAPIECQTLADGPFGVETQLHTEQVVLPLVRLVESRPDAAAFVIACYSDPGLDACRAVTRAPVFGIQESGILTALSRGDRIGVIAIAEASVARHRKYMRRMGLLDRLAGERALGLSVDDTTHADAFARLEQVGRALVAGGADAIVLGCAGMAGHRAALEAALRRPVIDPTQAAVAMALGAVLTR
jgi:Asp/Glu/hydantoin racemase